MRRWLGFAVLAFGLGAGPALAMPADCSKGPLFAGPAQGFFNNVPFAVETASVDAPYPTNEGRTDYDVYHIVLNSRDGMILDVMVASLKGHTLDGQTVTLAPHGVSPDIAPGVREVQTWSVADQVRHFKVIYFQAGDATMQLAFGHKHGGQLPLQLHFCVPSKRTEVSGQAKLIQN